MPSWACISACAPGMRSSSAFTLSGGPFFAQKFEDDADGFFRGVPIDADIGDETRDQLVHDPLTPSRTDGGLPLY